MTNKINKELYAGEIKIEFFPDSHRYKLEGERTYLISVTAVTGIIDKSRFLIPWAVGLADQFIRKYLEENTGRSFTSEELYPVIEEAIKQHTIKMEKAATIGSTVHDWAEKFSKSIIEGRKLENIEFPEDAEEQVKNGINAFLKWYNENNVEFLEVERFVYSKRHSYCGRFDVLAKVNGELTLIDYKTSKYGDYPENRLQLAAYKFAYEEENNGVLMPILKIPKVAVLHFEKDTGKFNVFEYEDNNMADINAFLGALDLKKRLKELSTY